MTIALITHPSCELHDNGNSLHPECAERLGAINNRLIASGVDWVCHHYDAPEADWSQLERVHTAEYLAKVRSIAPQNDELINLDGDTAMNKHTLSAARHAAGAAIQAVDLVMAGKHRHTFCAIRPPGHHAYPDHSSGFCIFNNIAVAAKHALDHYGLERVAIIDFDVHHGDGTEAVAKDDPRILFCSSFQHPYYPYKGADTDVAHVINLPLPKGTKSPQWRSAVYERWLPALEEFKPQLILISAGFDSHMEDDMGDFNLVEADYVWITKSLCNIAQRYAEGRVVSCLEGGYELSSLGRSVTEHVRCMAEYTGY
ncbi:histone deacetylase family protein [Thiofilum flexile]|uniref:histone deacetylase family protein n=1 Tax=Thiofilum flexile TaxID=125627 RepID=UPI00037A825F|nr:histone deacetylase family protein [Thiofilum flexile]